MSKLVEVEGAELAIKSSKGFIAIIPKNKAAWVKTKLLSKDYKAIDQFVSTLKNIDTK